VTDLAPAAGGAPTGRPGSGHDGPLVVRAPRTDEVEAVVELNEELFGGQEVPAVRQLLEDGLADDDGIGGGPEWLVVADEGDPARPVVAAACARLPLRFDLDGVVVPGCQLEWVTTAASHRGRGLIRSLFAAHHARSSARGELVQLIVGIPYFYRKLGYGYALDAPPTIGLDPERLRRDPAVTVRRARWEDAAWLEGLEAGRDRVGLTVVRDRSTFEGWLGRSGDLGDVAWDALLVAEAGGHRVGWVRLFSYEREAQLHVLGGWAPDSTVAEQLLVGSCDQGRGLADRLGRPVEALAADPSGTPWSRVLHRCGRVHPEPTGIYGRTPDPLALLRRLRPVFGARLAASGLAADRGEVVVSLYEQAVTIAWEGSRVEVSAAPADPEPFEHGGVGVAPDWFPALALGRWGASELAARVDDVVLGDHGPVMDVLFPRRPCDLVVDV
jgi:predicted N-acetyltransferase YhbS